MQSLTKRQREIFDFIQSFINDNGYPPTRSEIATYFQFKSPNSAEDHLRAIENKGWIKLIAGKSRGIALADQLQSPTPVAANEDLLHLPVLGRVAAGSPTAAIEDADHFIQVDPHLFQQTPDYFLQVKGVSMKDIGIFEGDYLAVKRKSDARNGQIVVARIDDEVTVKRFVRQGNQIMLLPENTDLSPIVVQADQQFAIEGIAVGLIRSHAFF